MKFLKRLLARLLAQPSKAPIFHHGIDLQLGIPTTPDSCAQFFEHATIGEVRGVHERYRYFAELCAKEGKKEYAAVCADLAEKFAVYIKLLELREQARAEEQLALTRLNESYEAKRQTFVN